MRNMKPSMVPEALVPIDDIPAQRLLKTCDGRGFDQRRDEVHQTLSNTGMRRAEAADLLSRAIHWDDDVHCRQRGPPRSRPVAPNRSGRIGTSAPGAPTMARRGTTWPGPPRWEARLRWPGCPDTRRREQPATSHRVQNRAGTAPGRPGGGLAAASFAGLSGPWAARPTGRRSAPTTERLHAHGCLSRGSR